MNGDGMEYVCTHIKIDSILTGNKIKALMNQKQVDVKLLANSLGVSNQAVYKWLNGKALPSLDNIFQISKLLGTSVDELIVTTNCFNYHLPEIYVREDIHLSYS